MYVESEREKRELDDVVHVIVAIVHGSTDKIQSVHPCGCVRHLDFCYILYNLTLNTAERLIKIKPNVIRELKTYTNGKHVGVSHSHRHTQKLSTSNSQPTHVCL